MRILLAILHYWDPQGDGQHQSLRPNPAPRIAALQDQLLALRRLGLRRSYLHMGDRAAYPADEALRHQIDVRIITDGEHHVLDQLDAQYQGLFEHVVTTPETGRMLGFEVQRYLASQLENDYDQYAYFEDDLVIQDPFFFHKFDWFEALMGPEVVLLPQRVELARSPSRVDRFYIDGPLADADWESLNLRRGPVLVIPYLNQKMAFETPRNPHAGCFVLSAAQLHFWNQQPWWLDRDCSFISPLESAATLGLIKTFRLYKPCLSHAAWLEVQHWGTSFHSLIEAS
jgi:hypothetical protein